MMLKFSAILSRLPARGQGKNRPKPQYRAGSSERIPSFQKMKSGLSTDYNPLVFWMGIDVSFDLFRVGSED